MKPEKEEALPPLRKILEEVAEAFETLTDGGGVDTYALAKYIRAALAQRQQVPTTAWLVEWRFNGVQWLYLWPSAPGGFSFTSDASKALRFARREDAEAALQWARDTDAARRPIGSLTRHGLALGEMLVTEHDWPSLTAEPSAQAEIPDLRCAKWLDPECADAGACQSLKFKAAPSAQAELRMIECPGCGMEFADGALHNANLELRRLKNAAQEAPAIRLALDSSLVAARKALEGKSGVDFLEGWVEFVAILRAAPPTAQAEPQVPLPCGQCRKADSWGIPLSKTCVYDCKFEPLNGIGKQEGSA